MKIRNDFKSRNISPELIDGVYKITIFGLLGESITIKSKDKEQTEAIAKYIEQNLNKKCDE